MLPRPIKRNAPSSSASIVANVFFKCPGAAKGSNPSITNTNAKAENKSDQFIHFHAQARPAAGIFLAGWVW